MSLARHVQSVMEMPQNMFQEEVKKGSWRQRLKKDN